MSRPKPKLRIVLLADFGIEALKRRMVLETSDGRTAPLIEMNGLYYVDAILKDNRKVRFQIDGGSNVNFTCEPDVRHVAHESHPVHGFIGGISGKLNYSHFLGCSLDFGLQAPLVAAAAAQTTDPALLWASRLCLDTPSLLKTAKLVHGIDVKKIGTRVQEAIHSNQSRAIAQARHHGAGSTPQSERATEPGEVFVCDGFGKHHAPSPIDKSVYQLHAVCEHSSLGYIGSVKQHTSVEWIAFIKHVISVERPSSIRHAFSVLIEPQS